MKIAIIRHTVRNRGSDNAFFNYANYLIQHGHEVFYYTNFRETNLAFNPAIRFQQVPYRGALGTIFLSPPINSARTSWRSTWSLWRV